MGIKEFFIDDMDTPYVISFDVSEDRKQWSLVWTTRSLSLVLANQPVKTSHVQIDATYKLLYQGFPYFPVGFSDANKKFFGCVTALCSGETIWCYSRILSAVRKICTASNESFSPIFVMSDADVSIESGSNLY
jgi:hypothetical protein